MRNRADRPVAVPANVGPGTVLSDRFKLIKPIGSGGMAVVWRAEHLDLGIHVALKMLRPVDVHSSVARARFEKEARTVAALRHPNVVHILEYGMHGDLPYLAMELLEGETLAKRLSRKGGKLDPTMTVWLVEQIARSVDKAHTLGIVHRDIKPENIFLQSSDDGEVPKLVDFGIAKLIDGDSNDSLTRTDAVIGTTHYLSPERARGRKPLDGKVDLWALAVVVYECVVGQRPFDEHSDDLLGLLKAIAEVDYPPPSMLSAVPPDFDAWTDQALNPNPDRRFASAAEMAAALRDALLPGTVASTTGMVFEKMDEGMLPIHPGSPDTSELPFETLSTSETSSAVVARAASVEMVVDAPTVETPAPVAQLRRLDLSTRPRTVSLESSLQPTDCAVLDVDPPTIVAETYSKPAEEPVPTETVQQPVRLGSDTQPIVSSTATVAIAPPRLSAAPPVVPVPPKRDWRLFAVAGVSMLVASGIGVSLVRLVTPRASQVDVTEEIEAPAPPVSVANVIPLAKTTPTIAASALPPAISVAPPVLDVERLPVSDQEPSSPPPTHVQPPRHNAGGKGTGRKPHEVFGL